MIALQVALTALTILMFVFVFDVVNDGIPRFMALIGWVCIFVIPISLIIQIWQI